MQTSGEPCREATLICTNSAPERGGGRNGRMVVVVGGGYMDVCAERWMVCDRRGKVEEGIRFLPT